MQVFYETKNTQFQFMYRKMKQKTHRVWRNTLCVSDKIVNIFIIIFTSNYFTI